VFFTLTLSHLPASPTGQSRRLCGRLVVLVRPFVKYGLLIPEQKDAEKLKVARTFSVLGVTDVPKIQVQGHRASKTF